MQFPGLVRNPYCGNPMPPAFAVWSRLASPRAGLAGSPALSRPNLFAGD